MNSSRLFPNYREVGVTVIATVVDCIDWKLRGASRL